MRFVNIFGVFVLGIVIVVAALVYDVLFAGIPYQDPTPELQARYDFHRFIASVLYSAGGVVMLVGLVAIPFLWKRMKKN